MSDILIGKGEQLVHLLAKYGNRHGLIAGATGTGKTITLELLAEGFSRIGVPVFVADVKGDVAGLAMPGTLNEKIQQRIETIGMTDFVPAANPVVFWDLFGVKGHPVRATISEIGPTLLARILELNDVQEGALEVVFKLADDRGLLLLDLDDLRALLTFVSENAKEVSAQYGLVRPQSLAAIQRALLTLEREGGTQFFGEPALELADLMRVDEHGRGIINILAADQLILRPRLYSSFLLWLISELFENLPEVGDLDKPKLAFFFDEAHLLFDDAPPALKTRVEQVVRLIRSKGVGIYFCSQFPDDVPNDILGQLGNRFQHALRAYTPRDQKAVRTAAETFVPNPKLNTAEVLPQLGVGEALVSTLQQQAIPMPVQRVLVCPPRCRMGAITSEEYLAVRASSPVGAKYDHPVNRESAYEILSKRRDSAEPPAPNSRSPKKSDAPPEEPPAPNVGDKLNEILWGTKRRQGMVEALAKSAARGIGSNFGRKIARGILGSIFGGTRR